MNTLALHIENLLLENDCVIVPGFGGFVAHNTSAMWCKEEESFLPPCRVIGFNPQLVINDGVLVQSYMAAYDTNFSDATKIIEKEVGELVQTLQEEGKIELPNVGEIYYSIDNSYSFKPYNHKLVSPSYYGLGSFEMTELCNLRKMSATTIGYTAHPSEESKSDKHYEIRINRVWVRNGVAAAIAFIMFFSLSTPLQNTYVPQENYARLLPADLFKKIEKESLLTAIVGKGEVKDDPAPAAVEEVVSAPVVEEVSPSPAVEKVVLPAAVAEKVVPAPAVERVIESVAEIVNLPASSENKIIESPVSLPAPVESNSDRTYHIIIASVLNEEDAEKIASNWRENGHQGAQVIARDGRIRVSIMSYADRAEGEKQLHQLRQNDSYKNAWLLPVK